MSRKIGHYEIKREIGQGGMGTVYMGYDPRLDREVAIKVLKPKLYMEAPDFSARFEQEAKIVASLIHNVIVPIYDYNDDGQWRYFVMPYLRGGSLHDRLEKGPLPLEKALPILQRVASGLDKAHSNNIVHRDLKPGNILFDEDGEAYLCDFGIMKLADPTGKTTVQMTSTGLALGTPHYMSPEQLDGVADLDGRSDIYALGIILYEMLTGKKPFDHESIARIIAMHYSSPVPNILEADPTLPPKLKDVIQTAMAKRRNDRFQSGTMLFQQTLAAVKEHPDSSAPRQREEVVERASVEPKPIKQIIKPDPVITPVKHQQTGLEMLSPESVDKPDWYASLSEQEANTQEEKSKSLDQNKDKTSGKRQLMPSCLAISGVMIGLGLLVGLVYFVNFLINPVEPVTNPTATATLTVEESGEPVAFDPTDEMLTEEPTEELTKESAEEPTENVPREIDTYITVWADSLLTSILNELDVPFQEEYGIGLIVENVPDRNDQFPIAVPVGEGPDIIMLPHDRLGSFVESGLLAPIDLSDKVNEFYPAAIQAMTFNGQLYAVPYNLDNLALFYNTDLVASPPETWDELIDVGADLVDSGDAIYALALAGTTYDAFPLYTAFGGYIFGVNADGTYNSNDLGIDSEGMIAAGNFLQDNIEAGYISSFADWDTAHRQFETGEIPFLMAGPWDLDRFRESGIPYAISSFPSATHQGAPFLGVYGFAINSNSENYLQAHTFLTSFLASSEVMQNLADGGMRPSAWRTIENTDPDLVAIGEAAKFAQIFPSIPEMGSVWGSWIDASTLIITGEQEPIDALESAAANIRDLINN